MLAVLSLQGILSWSHFAQAYHNLLMKAAHSNVNKLNSYAKAAHFAYQFIGAPAGYVGHSASF
jgi:hypothetical protein